MEHDTDMNELLQHLVRSGMFVAQNDRADEGDDGERSPVLRENNLESIAELINDGRIENIVVMSGAGVSTAAGIPDFRTPGSGIYHRLQEYNLPDPAAMFEIGFFASNPEPFCHLAKTLYPGNFAPTLGHCFVMLLEEKGLLLRNFTQNIDNLERIAGVPPDKLVEAHGTFATCHCIKCHREVPESKVKECYFADRIPRCSELGDGDEVCDGLVKPDIVFFGEALPRRFFDCAEEDMAKADLLIVMGTSLKVHPFAGLVGRVRPRCARLLINREKVGEAVSLGSRLESMLWGLQPTGFRFESCPLNRDVALLGDCDDGALAFCRAMGGDWEEKLHEIYERTRLAAREDSNNENSSSNDEQRVEENKEERKEVEAAKEGDEQ